MGKALSLKMSTSCLAYHSLMRDVGSFLGLIEEAGLKFINLMDIYLLLFECWRALELAWEWEGEDGLEWREQEMC